MDSGIPQLSIVLVEDHDTLRMMLKQALEEAGHEVLALTCAEELEDEAHGQPVDVFLIDLNLPGENGLSLTDRLRSAYPLAGLIVVTASSALPDKLAAYASGADIYLTKPVQVPELCAVVAAIGRRRERFNGLLSSPDALTLSQQNMRLSQSGRGQVALTAAEVSLLVAFARAPSQRLAYWQLAETLSLDPQTYAKATLEVRLVRLRKKLIEAGAGPGCIEAIRNTGYQLCTVIQVV